jgi:O-Antigen ligase
VNVTQAPAPRLWMTDVASPRSFQRSAALLTAMGVGVCAGFGAWWIGFLFIIPAVLIAAMRLPEAIIVLFLTAGLYKADPRIASLVPYDLTVLLGGLLALALLPRLRNVRMPRVALLLVPLFAVAGWGVVAPANAYGADKALRFCTLTALVTVSSIVIVDPPRSLRRFLIGLAALGFVTSIDALMHQETTQWGRLTFGGSNPIPLGRIGAIAFAFAWLRFHFARGKLERLVMVAALAFTAACTVASGSRGPVLSILGSLVVVSVVTYSAHRRAPLAVGPLIVGGIVALVLAGFAGEMARPLQRFQLLFSEDKGGSILVRGFMYMTAWKLTLTHPFGIGIGGFESYAPLDLRYPHNLFLEVGCELGWIPLIGLIVFLGLSLWTTVRILRREYAWHTLFLSLVFVSALLNAMVSGDLNDNRLLNATFFLPFLYARMQASALCDRRHRDDHSVSVSRRAGGSAS